MLLLIIVLFTILHIYHHMFLIFIIIHNYIKNKTNVTLGLSVGWISVLLIQLHEHPCITNTLYVALIEYTGYNRKDYNGLQIERNIMRKRENNRKKRIQEKN